MTRALLPLLFATASAGVALSACARETAMNEVRETLRVEASGGKVLVRVTIDNGTKQPVWVPAAIARDEELMRREFEVQADGRPVDYSGPMVKRGPYTAEDYVRVEPHARVEHTLDITPSYAWPAGSHAYTVGHEGYYLTDIGRLDARTPLRVERAAFFR